METKCRWSRSCIDYSRIVWVPSSQPHVENQDIGSILNFQSFWAILAAQTLFMVNMGAGLNSFHFIDFSEAFWATFRIVHRTFWGSFKISKFVPSTSKVLLNIASFAVNFIIWTFHTIWVIQGMFTLTASKALFVKKFAFGHHFFSLVYLKE